MLKLNIYLTDMTQQNILNEISTRTFDRADPAGADARGGAPELAHPDMLLEIEGVAAVPIPARASARKKAGARKPVRKAAQKAAKRGGRARR